MFRNIKKNRKRYVPHWFFSSLAKKYQNGSKKLIRKFVKDKNKINNISLLNLKECIKWDIFHLIIQMGFSQEIDNYNRCNSVRYPTRRIRAGWLIHHATMTKKLLVLKQSEAKKIQERKH